MAFVAGQRIESRCTRCKDTTGHIVIVVLDSVPVKVECCACGSVHKYYSPEGKKKTQDTTPLRVRSNQSRNEIVAEASKKNAPTSATSAPKTKQTSSARSSEDEWKSVLSKTYAKPKAYNMSVSLGVGESVDHSLFGVGIVQAIVGNDKASILFREGLKVLKCIPR